MLKVIIVIVVIILLLILVFIVFLARVMHNVAEMDHGYYMDETIKKE